MAECLIELFSEEIPARMQARAAEDLARLIRAGLDDAGLSPPSVRAFVTPRRLTVVADGLPTAQPDRREERRGPRADAPPKAVEGFLSAVGLSIDQVEKRETPKGMFLFAMLETKGRATAEVLPEVLNRAMAAMVWPKSMRWGTGRFTWVRPLHGVLAVFDGKPLPGGLDLGNGDRLPFTDITRGHRFLAPEPFAVTGFEDYRTKLAEAGVVLDAAERRARILETGRTLAGAEGLTLNEDDALLAEVAGLVELPVPLLGRIDGAYMDLPPELLVTTLRVHQKYFTLADASGALAPRFLLVANGSRPEAHPAIVAGNERVLRARLADARFFWDQDRARRLDSRVDALKDRIFHARLGSDHDRVMRIRRLAGVIARAWRAPDPALTDRAALLAKADLSTGMVGEFPELQGIIGAYYARHDDEPGVVAEAIRSHYAPLGPSDACPSEPVAVAVALADKLDTLAGFWLIDEKPTGSKDPFALRRAALGVIRLIVENAVRLPLTPLIDAAEAGHREQRSFAGGPITGDLIAFIAERLKVRERDRGTRHDLIAAVFALKGEDDLVRLLARASALQAFLGTSAGADLLAAYRRAANIVRIEAKKDGAPPSGAPDPAMAVQDEERTLMTALATVSGRLSPLLETEAFAEAMAELARLRGPVDAFFEAVTVNADDPALRANRLRLLDRIGATMETVADFSKIEG